MSIIFPHSSVTFFSLVAFSNTTQLSQYEKQKQSKGNEEKYHDI